MNENELKLVFGALLHDTGKPLYRFDESNRKHSISGHDFLKNEVGITDKDILNQVRYHHGDELSKAKLEVDSLAYITYIADNMASSLERRKITEEGGFNRRIPLDSIFNNLNGNAEKKHYKASLLDVDDITYPTDAELQYDEGFYGLVKNNTKNALKQIELDVDFINSLLEVLEANHTFVPSSTDKSQVPDISLYDHEKLTAALALCIYKYLKANGFIDYKKKLYSGATEFYAKKVFLMYAIDVSGIQDFIYTITDSGALKTLRSKSFYLEMIVENYVDELFDRLGLCRTNLMYTGGGHAYMILPNTQKAKDIVNQFEEETNKWLMENFKTDLYIATGMCECSSNDLQNATEGAYKNIFTSVKQMISEKKMKRYTASDIRWLNKSSIVDGQRECKICHRTDLLNKDNLCEICGALVEGSSEIVNAKFFTVLANKPEKRVSLPLSKDRYLVFDDKEELVETMKNAGEKEYIRTYVKNELYSGLGVSTKIWVGDYKKQDTFTDLVNSAKGIKRLGVLRADVDNLGATFVEGLKSDRYGEQLITISRTSTLSRKISIFFKQYVNEILKDGEFYLYNNTSSDKQRNAMIVYSGGDDVFVIGAWDDIIGFAVDLHNKLDKYTQGTLTISAGIGIFPDKTPVSHMARVTGKLEDSAKARQEDGKVVKNGICLFEEDKVFGWEEFVNEVCKEKLDLIERYLRLNSEKGKNFIYNMLDLIRNEDDKINIARFAYAIARIEPNSDAKDEVKEMYQEFRTKMYTWYKNENKKDKKQLITAIYLYVYLNREEE